ncbi:MAG: glycogen phosphorylase [Elusimicrobia bacterium RIFOXYA2_FULL_39_19]|nr:MAG: glycogen phosphorylase [Elusimicrobia bacterium RIFOXYA2_FULL_39_19]
MDVDALRLSFQNHLHYTRAKDEYSATDFDKYLSLAYTVRDRIVEKWSDTQQTYYNINSKRVYYLSLEFLMGRLVLNNIVNLKVMDEMKYIVKRLGYDFDKLTQLEPDAGLGNGGLGRLAACFLDSMATIGIPGYGYGLRYEFGIFNQKIENGFQVEEPEEWLKYTYPWEIERPEYSKTVRFNGDVVQKVDEFGKTKYIWQNTNDVLAVPHDVPIIGYGNNIVNTLRLWAARASNQFDLHIFNHGDYIKAIEDKNYSENISRVLYPNDNILEGKELRLKQEYFFVSATLQDILRRYNKTFDYFDKLPEQVAVQLNDTHPALGILELMRLLVDEHNIEWTKAWGITTKVFAFTNHTVMAEALEKWPVKLLEKLIPRNLQILYKINADFIEVIKTTYPNDMDKVRNMSLVEENGEKQARMANLAIVGSHSVNGVAKLHSEILKTSVFKDFYEMMPGKFNNKTNGISFRRWLLVANPDLSHLISGKIGESWVTEPFELKKLEDSVDDEEFLVRLYETKKINKKRFTKYIKETMNVDININSLFDVQIKRIHEYKRQFLSILHVLVLYNRIKKNPNIDMVPVTFFYGGKSAPGYYIAKLIIKLINSVADLVNNDPAVNSKIKVLFIPNYSVSIAEKIMPAADVSKHISTAGKEASGTSNMKFSLNGALTVGTLDGANIEIMNEVGEDNIYIFGLKAEEVEELIKNGKYNPSDYYNKYPEIKRVVDMLKTGEIADGDETLFKPLYDSLINGVDNNSPDQYFVLADLPAYIKINETVYEDYKDKVKWQKKILKNIANMGYFSSDRAIREYMQEIWNIKPVVIR